MPVCQYDRIFLTDLKIFVKCDSDIMLARRITRDVKERGRDLEGILAQYVLVQVLWSSHVDELLRYLRFVKPAYDDFVLPTSRYADIVRIYFLC